MKRTVIFLIVWALLITPLTAIFTSCESGENLDSTTQSTEDHENTTSETEESEDMKKEPINTEYVNAALGKRYERSALYPEDSPSYPDEMGKTMTDGNIASSSATFGDPAFMGFNQNATGYRENNYATIMVDLEKVYSLDKFVAHIGTRALGGGIDAPEFIWVYVADKFGQWYEAGLTTHTDSDSATSIAATLELDSPLTARYVLFRFHANGNWVFVSEVEAYGREAEEHIPYPEKEDVKNFLFVGNSATYYFNTAFKFKCLAESLGVNVDVTTCCFGSAYLSYYADPNKNPHNSTFKRKITEKSYDYVVLQDNSGADFNSAKYAIDILMPYITENGAEPLLYKRYSSNDDPAQRLGSALRHHTTYTLLSQEYGIDKVAAAADAFLICTEKYPEINLYHTDNSHHNSTGAYLTACVMAIEYLGLDITDATYTAGLDEDTARKLRECAFIACTVGYPYPEA